tara:strand:- start:42 stop:305 length:264 start_codon:yes stop_codon:yes gene_type:complete
MTLSNDSIKTIKAGEVLWDQQIPGFGARKQTANGVTAFIVKTRVNGRQKLVTLGRYPVLDIDTAREQARRILEVITIKKIDGFVDQI